MIRELRQIDGDVPIVAVSGIDRTAETTAAGANRFHSYDEWLRIGTVVAELLGVNDSNPPLVAGDTRPSAGTV